MLPSLKGSHLHHTTTGIWYKIHLTLTRFCLLEVYAVQGIAGVYQVLMDFILTVVSYSERDAKITGHCVFL